MNDLYIIGAGGLGRETAWLVERINQAKPTWNLKGLIDDNPDLWGTSQGDYPIPGGIEYLARQRDVYAVCAIGSATARKAVIERLLDSDVKFATLIDPSVIMSNRVRIGEGTIISVGSILTIDIEIGSHVALLAGTSIGHDCRIQDFVTVYPGSTVSGNVHVGECTEIGTGTQIIQGKTIAPHTIIGAGAVVVRDLTESGTYVGCPAKRIK